MTRPTVPPARRRDGRWARPCDLLVVQGVEHVEPRGPPRRHDRRADAGEDGDQREGDQRGDRERERQRVSTAPGSPARPGTSRAGGRARRRCSAVMTLSWRIIRRAWRRVMPIVAQHPDLARALEHREHERVDHAEQAHDHREARAARRAAQDSWPCPSWRPSRTRRRCGASASVKPADAAVERPPARRRPASRNVKLVLGLRERLVERLLGDADVAEQRVDLGRVVDAADDERAACRPTAS